VFGATGVDWTIGMRATTINEMRLRFALGVLVLLGCDDGPGPGGTLPGLLSLDVRPGDATLTVTNGVDPAQDYTAIGHFSSGDRDVTGQVLWSIDDPIASFTNGAHLVASTMRGGSSHVHARSGMIDGAAKLTVVFQRSQIGPGAPPD